LEDPSATPRSYLLDAGRFVRLDVPGALATQATGINSHAQVVGQYWDVAGRVHGFVWERGRFTSIDAPGSAGTSLSDLNDRGQLLGARAEPDGTIRGFVRDRGRYTSFAAPDAAITAPLGINNRGRIVGAAYRNPTASAEGFQLTHGVGGPVTSLGFPRAASTIPADINDHDQIVGGYHTTSAKGRYSGCVAADESDSVRAGSAGVPASPDLRWTLNRPGRSLDWIMGLNVFVR
jgi:uncharacterized membrane protein